MRGLSKAICCCFLLVGLLIGISYAEDKDMWKITDPQTAFKRGSADFIYDLATEEYKQGNNDKAIEYLTLAIKQNPQFGKAYYNRGVVYCKQNKFDIASKDFSKAIKLTSDKEILSQSYYNKGVIFSNRNDYRQAIDSYTKTIEIDPDYAAAYKNRAVAYFYNKDYDSSWKDIKKAVGLGMKFNPDFINDLEKASGRSRESL